MGFSSNNPNTVGNMLQSYVASKSPLLGAGINSLAGDGDNNYGLNKDGTASRGVFAPQTRPDFMAHLFNPQSLPSTPPHEGPPLSNLVEDQGTIKKTGFLEKLAKAMLGVPA